MYNFQTFWNSHLEWKTKPGPVIIGSLEKRAPDLIPDMRYRLFDWKTSIAKSVFIGNGAPSALFKYFQRISVKTKVALMFILTLAIQKHM